jgi:CheY-like chemotaxis protein
MTDVNDGREAQTAILIVDDDPSVMAFFVDFLREEFSLYVDFASTVEVAIGKMQERYYDLLLTDYTMPVTMGDVFISLVRDGKVVDDEKTRTMPIILVTTSERNPEYIARQYSVAYITKPFDLDRVIELMETLLGHKL